MKKKVSSIILTLVLLIGMMPMQILAATSKPAQVTGLKIVERHNPFAYQDGSGMYGSPVTISWKAAKYAKKYQVGFRTGTNSWKYKNTTKKKIKISDLSLYCKYDFKVRGVNGSKKGKWSEIISTYTKPLEFEVDFPDMSKALTVSNKGLGSLTIKWDFTEPTDSDMTDYSRVKYNVYCSTDTENWTLVGNKLDSKMRTFTQRGCNPGVVYYFKVQPIDNTSYKTFTVKGSMSNVVSAKVEVPEGLKIEEHFTTKNDEYILNRAFNLRGLVLHSVGDNIQSAKEWHDLYNGSMKSTASVHGFIDGTTGALWQTLPWEVRAGHAGAAGNNRYIGIEMCESKWLKYSDDYFTFTVEADHEQDAKDCAKTTYDAAVKLFAFLCDYYGLNPLKKGVVISHYEWGTEYKDLSGGGHEDPEHYWRQLGIGYTMDGFRTAVKELLNQYTE